MERLTAEDQLVLWPDEVWPQDIGALAVLDGRSLFDDDGRFRIEAVREVIAGRLHRLPRFRQRLEMPGRGLGGPLWVDASGFDLRHHAQVLGVPAPGADAQLLQVVELLRRRRLDRSRPLWEMWFLTGLPDQHVGLFVRLHHVIADGIAGVASLAALLDVAPDTTAAPARPWTPVPTPSSREMLIDHLRAQTDRLRAAVATLGHPVAAVRRARAAWPAVRELVAEEPGPETSLDRLLGPDRRLALIRGDLDLVQAAADAHDATVNDVLLTVIAGGLRGLLLGRGEPVEDLALPIFVPVSLRRQEPGQEGGNLISQMVVHLPLGITDPGRRLREIAAETTERKAWERPSLGTIFRTRLVRAAMLKLIVRQRVNLTSTDVPGPQTPLYFAGAPLLEVFPLTNLIGNVTLGVGALSYAGQFNMMVVADADAYPDLDVFASAARGELRTLVPGSDRERSLPSSRPVTSRT